MDTSTSFADRPALLPPAGGDEAFDATEELCLLRRAVAKAMASSEMPEGAVAATEQVLTRVAEHADRLVEYFEADSVTTLTLDACVAARLAIAQAERRLRSDCAVPRERCQRLQATRRALYHALAIVAEALARVPRGPGGAAALAAPSSDDLADALALRSALAELRDAFSLDTATKDPDELPWVLGVAESEIGIFCARAEFALLPRDARRALVALRSELGAWRRGPKNVRGGRWLCERLRGISELFPRLNLTPAVLTHDRVVLAELACLFASEPLWGRVGAGVVDGLAALRGLDPELDSLRLRHVYDAENALPAIERRVAELRFRAPRSSDWPTGARARWVGLA